MKKLNCVLGFCSFLFYFILLFFCANNHLTNVTAVEEGDRFFSVTASDICLVLTEV